ncbi:Uncharacterised protein [Legionella beliardensis]|uniref:Uncharacterized protein n=1 Tax=Legionella beliardensis TaxID=91822 RepID=A0A378HZS0_9GAMM|nr:hypothetical protein [Legionella beliardensis]STX28427.1 Uncharacterised protein [Legionella beliardensis]
MIKHYIRSTIIILLQAILPILALFILAPLLINKNSFAQWQHVLTNNQPVFIILHGLFYLALVWLWPKLITRLQTQNQLSPPQLSSALNIRWYLLTIFIFIDALMIWR